MSSSVSNSTLWTIGAGVAGVAFLGYCIYFDHKRRSAPDFKQKLRERRRNAKTKKATESSSDNLDPFAAGVPTSAAEMQAFFMQELQIGEELLNQGDIDNGLSHMANAVALCGQPRQIMQVMGQTLPEQLFKQLVDKVPTAQQRISSALLRSGHFTEAEMLGDTARLNAGASGPRVQEMQADEELE